MHIEDVAGLLRSAADRLFRVATELDGQGLVLSKPDQHRYLYVPPNGNNYARL